MIRFLLRLVLLFPWRGPRGLHVTRYTMYRELGRLARQIGVRPDARTASISESAPFCNVIGIDAAAREALDFPEYDLLDLKVPDNSYDVVACDQVLEHVAGSPQRAVDEMFRILKPGGYLFLSTCFVITLHLPPHDYWRFSPAVVVRQS